MNHDRLHSIEIDSSADRLWFTLASDSRVLYSGPGSTIGYLDLASWRDYLAAPLSGIKIEGVIYSGLQSVKADGGDSAQSHGFAGIAVNPESGKIAVASMHRREIVELTPHSAFRP